MAMMLALPAIGDGSASQVTITPLRPQLAHIAWVQHSFMLDIEDKARMATQFEQVSRLVELGITYTLDYPRNYDFLDEVRAAITAHAAGAGADIKG